MSDSSNKFIWYELMTPDTTAAAAFYQAVLGWDPQPFSAEMQDYILFKLGNTGVAGMMAKQADCPGPPGGAWQGYIGVEDTDAKVKQLVELGGSVMFGPEDIPEVGRFAVVADPHGAVFSLITPQGESPEGCPDPNDAGMVGWRELHAGHGEEAFQFYSTLFGWTKNQGVDMGDLGIYQTFDAGEETIGGMMTKMPDSPHPFWNYYFLVDEIQAGCRRVRENGGQVLMEAHEVPGGTWIAQTLDNQGAFFAIMSQKNSAA